MIDILYLGFNRLEFTRATFALLLQNTDWERVDRLVVYDDGSEDGTREYLEGAVEAAPVPTDFRETIFGSPVAVMNDYLASSEAEMFAKIDNDIAVPPGWLGTMLGVMERSPELELLGMEAGRTHLNGRDGLVIDGYSWEDASHIGGVGLMRTSAFRLRPPVPARGRFGFTEWQELHRPVRGWIRPDLLVPQIDRVPIEPWWSLSREYVGRGWQRAWRMMDPTWCEPYYDWLPKAEETAA